MQAIKSVCDIFHTMDSTDKICCNSQAREWLEKFENSDEYCGHITSSSSLKLKGMDPLQWRCILENVVSSMEVKSDFLIQLLNETVYNSKDSKEVVTTICKDFNIYFETAEDNAFYANEEAVVDLVISARDIYIVGRLIAPLLIAGYTIRIDCLDKHFLPFLVGIGDIITKAGVPKGTKYLFISPNLKEPEDPKRLLFRGDCSFYYCPMIIFEESDLDSALDCLIESCSRFNGMLYWSVTHAYVQESIFNDVVSKLENVTKRHIPVELLDLKHRDQLKADTKSTIIKLLIGWDPRDLEMDCNITLTVSLLPFRTLDEIVTNVNSQNNGCAASIWTEKLSVANYASKLLKFGTVWINSHGLIGPLVPIESLNETKLPLNGIQLLDYLTSLKMLTINYKSESNAVKSGMTDIAENNMYFSKSFEEAVNITSKGFEVLKKMDEKSLQKLLNSLHNDKKWDQNRVSLPCGTIIQPSSKIDVLCFSDSYKVLMIIFPSQKLPMDFFLEVLYSLVATRNAAIICGASSLLKQITALLPLELPRGIITLLDLEHYNQENTYSKRIGKTIQFRVTESDDVNSGNDLANINYLCSLFLSKKAVWIPID